MRLAAALAALAAGLAGCSHTLTIQRIQLAIRAVNCGDGLPAKILIDVRCPDSVCGFTCAPDRWR